MQRRDRINGEHGPGQTKSAEHANNATRKLDFKFLRRGVGGVNQSPHSRLELIYELLELRTCRGDKILQSRGAGTWKGTAVFTSQREKPPRPARFAITAMARKTAPGRAYPKTSRIKPKVLFSSDRNPGQLLEPSLESGIAGDNIPKPPPGQRENGESSDFVTPRTGLLQTQARGVQSRARSMLMTSSEVTTPTNLLCLLMTGRVSRLYLSKSSATSFSEVVSWLRIRGSWVRESIAVEG